jgi:hypothetical protein
MGWLSEGLGADKKSGSSSQLPIMYITALKTTFYVAYNYNCCQFSVVISRRG